MPSVYDLLNESPSIADRRNEGTVTNAPSPCAISKPTNNFSASGSDEEKDIRSFNIRGFAYSAARKSTINAPVRRDYSRAASASSSSDEILSPAKRAARSASRAFAEGFSEAELAKLLKCVVCESLWTARKTTVRKLKHIGSCAKRRSLTDATIAVMIRQEIDRVPILPEKKTKHKQQEAETLLQDAVLDAGAKRRGKRPAVVTTVKSLTETREQILLKARQLIGHPSARPQGVMITVSAESNTAEKTRLPPSTQGFGESALTKRRRTPHEDAQSAASLSAQAFGRSKLTSKPAHVVFIPRVEVPEDSKTLPSTQAFAPSKLAGSSRSSRGDKAGSRQSIDYYYKHTYSLIASNE
ncbi:uncharacterized protein LAESUDRAFT_15467 [Laetiporus sulphureus 93-53]|uniref:Uncharacterized protein n=1 Tax=Laetiporus sulphureus 93-53 TaxID=1314785 RepID=A0A165I9L2_9APHY|nr:uncharacterized protein LAESUDRAFT_15467 [Laetiporus sulphureus 93-53]KZT12771.1 hypothetical protein LAESUDRAFT_15467 [Laetiporus sulphureus 93-53]